MDTQIVSSEIDGVQLINDTKELAVKLIESAHEHTKLGSIKGSDELILKLDELLNEFREQTDKIEETIKTSRTVFHNLKSLHVTMVDVKQYFEDVNNSRTLMFSKSKFKRQIQLLYQTLRSKCTQLMTSVSLVLLSGKPVEEKPSAPNSELYTLGLNYYFGLAGRPKNYTRSFEKFIQAAEQGDADAMCMVSKCYLNQQGVEADPEAGLEWLVRAINTGRGCNYAKNELAMIIVDRLKEQNPLALREYFAGDGQDAERYSPDISRDFSRANSSVLHASYSSAKSSTQKSRPQSIQRSSVNNSNRASQQQQQARSELDSSQNGDDDDAQFHLSPRHYERQVSFSENHSIASQSQPADEQLEAERTVYDLEYAFRLLVEAATEDPGVEGAKTNLGVFFEECGDLEQAAKWYSLASNGGCSRATCKLATLFFNSSTDINKHTLTNNRHKAFSMFKMSAVNGEIEAFNGLGQCYETGVGVDIDLHLALINYLRGATEGDKQAMYNYGYIKIKNALDVQDSMKKMKHHSKMYLATHSATQASHNQWNESDEDAADSALYIDMAGRADDALQEGLHWLRCAAENGVADASYQIGQLYEKALGVPQDSTAALSNYLRAAKLLHHEAALYAANLLFEQIKEGTNSDIVSVMDLYKQAAEGGLPEAMNSLGILLEDGATHRMPHTNYEESEYAVTTDVHTAAMWYYAACQKGLSQAFLNLALVLAGDEQMYSFTALNGELITSEDAKRFIERRLSTDIRLDNGQQTEMVMNLLDSIHSAGSEEHKHQTLPQLKPAVRGQHGIASIQSSPIKTSQPSSGRSLKLSSSSTKCDPSSLVLRSSVETFVPHQKVNFASIASNLSAKSRSSTPLGGGHRTPGSTKLRDFVDLNSIHTLSKRTGGDSHNDGSSSNLPPQLSQQQGNRNFKALGTKIIQSNSFSHSNNNNRNNTIPLHTVSTSYQGGAGGASPGRSSQQRPGEIFMTNGPIPPPNYVPKATLQSAPQAASKPEAPSRGGVGANNAVVSSSFPRGSVEGSAFNNQLNTSTDRRLQLQNPNSINNNSHSSVHQNFTTGDSLVGGADGGTVSSPVARSSPSTAADPAELITQHNNTANATSSTPSSTAPVPSKPSMWKKMNFGFKATSSRATPTSNNYNSVNGLTRGRSVSSAGSVETAGEFSP